MRTDFLTPGSRVRADAAFADRLAQGGRAIDHKVAEIACRALAECGARDRSAILNAVDQAQDTLSRSGISALPRQLILEATARFFGVRNWDTLCGRIPKGADYRGQYIIEVAGYSPMVTACLAHLPTILPGYRSSDELDPHHDGLACPWVEGAASMAACFEVVRHVSKTFPAVLLTVCAVADDRSIAEARSFRYARLLDSVKMPPERLRSFLAGHEQDELFGALLQLIASRVRNEAVSALVSERYGAATSLVSVEVIGPPDAIAGALPGLSQALPGFVVARRNEPAMHGFCTRRLDGKGLFGDVFLLVEAVSRDNQGVVVIVDDVLGSGAGQSVMFRAGECLTTSTRADGFEWGSNDGELEAFKSLQRRVASEYLLPPGTDLIWPVLLWGSPKHQFTGLAEAEMKRKAAAAIEADLAHQEWRGFPPDRPLPAVVGPRAADTIEIDTVKALKSFRGASRVTEWHAEAQLTVRATSGVEALARALARVSRPVGPTSGPVSRGSNEERPA